MSQRRGACPDLFTPMHTGDGLLARIVPVEGITPAAFVAFCKAARRHGNGTIEVSARGSLQVRGLTAASAPRFAEQVAALDVAALGVPVLSSPLPDDPTALVDARTIAAKLRAAIADANLPLAPKVCVIIDGGGTLHLDALSADIRLRGFALAGEKRLALALAGDASTATPLGSIPVETAAGVVVEALRVVAARGDVRAAGVLHAEGLAAFSTLPHVRPESAPPEPRAPAEIIGVHPLREGSSALGIGLAFGHAEAQTLIKLVEATEAYGARGVRAAPGRALLLVGIADHNLTAVTREAERLGFVTRSDDPRRRIIACPGAPACASGFIAAREIALELAELLSLRPEEPGPSRPGVSKDGNARELGHPSRRSACGLAPQDEGSHILHISGCAKGCAHPKPAALTVVGSERGCGIVEHGTARANPKTQVDPQHLTKYLARRVSEPAHG